MSINPNPENTNPENTGSVNASPVNASPVNANLENNNLENNNLENSNLENKNQKKERGRLGNLLFGLVSWFRQIFSEYPITIIVAIIATFIGCLLINNDFDSDFEIFLQKAMVTLWITFAGTLVSEQYIKKFNLPRICSYLVSNVVGIVFVVLIDNFEIDHPFAFDITLYVLSFYLFTAAVITVYKMFKDNKKENDCSFANYCIRVFSQVSKATIVYGLFIIGITIIILIFNFLIFDTEDFDLLIRVILFLTGGIYLPALIKSFAHTKEEVNKFVRFVTLFVLFPLLLAAFVIIYIYIFKLIITWSLPSNEVYRILAFLFAVGLPIWTMAMSFSDKFLGKISRFVPFAYVPFILLESICIFLRINEYGITPVRYFAVVFIILQICYIVIYGIRLGQYVEYLAFVCIGILAVILFMPGINYNDMTLRSQVNMMEKLLDGRINDTDNIPLEEKAKIKSSYNSIRWSVDSRGDKYIADNYSKKFLKELENWDSYYYDWMEQEYKISHKSYYCYMENNEVINIAGYSKIYTFNEYMYYSNEPSDNVILSLNFNTGANDSCSFTYDITGIIQDFASFEDNLDNSRYPYDNMEYYKPFTTQYGTVCKYFEAYNYFILPDGNCLYVQECSTRMADDQYENCNIKGYLLEK